MKNIFRFLIFNLFLSTAILSQTTTIYLSAGYDIPVATAVIGGFQSGNEIELNTTTYAKGFLIQGGYQLIINNNFVFDLNFNYQFGLVNEIYRTTFNGDYGSYSTSNISVAPSICVKIDVGDISPYAKFGFSINFISLDSKSVFDNSYNIKFENSFQSDFTFGILGGIGIDFLIDYNFIPYIEAQLNSITYYPDEVDVTEYHSDGTNSKQTYQLVDKIDVNSFEENESLTNDFPYSSLGIIVGIRYLF